MISDNNFTAIKNDIKSGNESFLNMESRVHQSD